TYLIKKHPYKLKHLHPLICLIFFLFIGNSLFGQQKFQLIDGIPHLTGVGDPASVADPEVGMLLYDTTENQPLIYTGNAWESWCTTDISVESSAKFFIVKNDFPYLPVLNQPLVNGIAQGTIYYSTVD